MQAAPVMDTQPGSNTAATAAGSLPLAPGSAAFSQPTAASGPSGPQPVLPPLRASTSVPASVWARYDRGEKIGEGTYGLVYHALSKETGGRFAIKQFKSGREGDGISPTAIREIMLLRYLSHPHIVRLESVHIHRAEPSLWLAFDYAEHDLYEMIRAHKEVPREVRRGGLPGLMPQYTVKSVMWQMLNGLNYLHQNWIMHRDLKPSNVLVMADAPNEPNPSQQGQVKIADFGLARIFQAPLRPLAENGVVVTIWYRAPELLLGSRHYTRAVDVWAAGCIFAELMMLRPLFQGAERKQSGNAFQGDQIDKIFRLLGRPSQRAWPDLEFMPHWFDNTENVRMRKPEHEFNMLRNTILETMKSVNPAYLSSGVPAECRPSDEGFKLLHRLLDYNQATRITAAEALEHEYFKEEPRPGPNIFHPPGAAQPAVRYACRPMTMPSSTLGPDTSQPAGGSRAGTGVAGTGSTAAGGPTANRAAGAGLPKPPAKRRKVEPAFGFR